MLCQLNNIHKSFTMGETVRPIIDLNFKVNSGDFIAIEGPSGSGKTTLLNLLGALLKADKGDYIFEGKKVYELNMKELAELRAKKIGFLFQNTNLIQALTVRENIKFVGEKFGVSDEKIDRIIEYFGLTNKADYLPYQLSGGQKRRAGAARSLIHNPMLILADEPTNDLDEHWSDVMMTRLKDEADRGAAVVLVTHNLNLRKYANQIYYLNGGYLRRKS